MLLTNTQAADSFWAALRRIAIFMNSGKGRPCSLNWLKKTDVEIANIFVSRDLNGTLVQFRKLVTQDQSNTQIAISDVDRAEHEFYGRIQFQKRTGLKRQGLPVLHITFDSTEAFWDWSLKRLHIPHITNESLAAYFKTAKVKALQEAFTNYLVKNFWHNAVHRRIQGIHELNFHEFGGDARYESDFTADNLANLFLLRSYGLPVHTKGKLPTDFSRSEIRKVFSMNRCNLVFAERAEIRDETTSPLQEFQERLWRFKRSLANVISQELALSGSASTDVAIYTSGSIQPQKDSRESYYSNGSILTRINGKYINSELAAYTSKPGKSLSSTQVAERRRERISNIATITCSKYRAALKANAALRSQATEALNATILRMQSY